MPDFANSSLVLFDAYANLRYFPKAQLEAGKFKPPVGLERLQSATATMFIERAFPTLLVPTRDIGAMLWSDQIGEGLFTYQFGYFNGVRDSGNNQTGDVDTDDGKDFAARLFFHPFRPLENEWLDGFGIGVAGTWGEIDEQAPDVVPDDGRRRRTSSRTAARPPRSTRSPATAIATAGRRRRTGTRAPSASWPSTSRRSRTCAGRPSRRSAATRRAESLRNDAWQVALSYVLTGENASYKGVISVERPSRSARAVRARARSRPATTRSTSTTTRSTAARRASRTRRSRRARRRAGPSASTGT